MAKNVQEWTPLERRKRERPRKTWIEGDVYKRQPARNVHYGKDFPMMFAMDEERNRLELSTLEAISQILVNKRTSYSEFYNNVLEDKIFLNL